MMRNVFLTGGSRGIGAAAVLALARAGYNVAFTYHAHPEAAEAVAAQARALSPAGDILQKVRIYVQAAAVAGPHPHDGELLTRGGHLGPVDAALIAGHINAVLKKSHKKSPFAA